MIVVVGNAHDKVSQKLVKRWSSSNAVLSTCEDLSSKGWRHYLGAPNNSTAIVGGRAIRYDEINGVLIRRPYIFEQELIQILSTDRTYVAAEMNAFLVSWLSSLRCPVLNRPTSMCLSGPNWRREQWVHAASLLSIPVKSMDKYKPLSEYGDTNCFHEEMEKVTVVGELCFGKVEEAVADQARRLSRFAGTEILEVQFSGSGIGSFFLSANPCPDLDDTDISDAVLRHLLYN